jgi:PelA/Pel-15E family pectate lyase
MRLRLHALPCATLAVWTLLAAAVAAQPPKPWPAEAFLPLTTARIAALPTVDQAVWRSFWEKSITRRRTLSARDLTDYSPLQPVSTPPAGASYSRGLDLDARPAWYATEEARMIADHVVDWQIATGGWTKGGDYRRNRKPEDNHDDVWSLGTFDNNSTIYELRFLARVSAASADQPELAQRVATWRASFLRGLDYIFDAQYPNGGFPQIYPLAGGYHDAITFNDDAFVHILELLGAVGGQKAEFAFVSADQAALARERWQRGIRCLLAAQLRDNHGQRTVWSQQVDALTLQPCAARNFEPIAECSNESAGLVEFLLGVESPTPEIAAAVEGAMAWFQARALHGVVWNREAATGSGLEPRGGAPDLWARFYEIGTGRPIFGERDRTIHYVVTEISLERRRGYSWFNSRAVELFPRYETWRLKHARK